MTKLNVAFQGEKGAYSEDAAFLFFDKDINPVPKKDFKLVFESVNSSVCDYGIIPIENSTAGSIHKNYDLLLKNNLKICGELKYRVRHNLMVLQGVKLDQVKRIYSHPQALDQCSEYLESLEEKEIIPTYDTAGSARQISENGEKAAAAIASVRAAKVYNLDIIADAIENNHNNYTRFLVISREHQPFHGTAKTSIVFSMKDIPGALFKALAVFALREINLLKIESRPLPDNPWNYMFYLDFMGHVDDEACHNAINHLKEITTFLKVLGTYPEGKQVR